MSDLNNVLFLSNLLDEICQVIPYKLHEIQFNLCLCIAECSVQLFMHGYEPTLVLLRLKRLLKICPCAAENVLLAMIRALNVCWSNCVLQITNFCLNIIQNYGCHKIIAQTLLASIFQWNQNKGIINDSIESIVSTVNFNSTSKLRSCQNYHEMSPFMRADCHITMSIQLIKLCAEFDNQHFITKWLAKIKKSTFLSENTLFSFFVAGLYLCKRFDNHHQQSLLNLINKKYLLPFITYAINNETNCYKKLHLLQVVPTTACMQENVSLVINLIKQFEECNEETLQIYSIIMYFDLWTIESRCYRFLLYSISKDKPGWQWNVVKAYTVQKLVKTNPNSDLVPILKQMLAFYIKHKLYLPMKLTLESLIELCSAEYLSSEALLKIFDKNIGNIHHPSVISSYCDLLAESAIQTTDNKVRTENIQKLWSLVLHSNINTIKCALKSLSKIDLENMPMRILPQTFQSIPNIVTQLEDLEKLELLEGPILGECWIKFIQNINAACINEALSTLSIWLGQELIKNTSFRVPSDHEPKSLKHLPEYSIARGLMSFVVPKRKKMLDTDERLKQNCLVVLNGTDKPMYAFDWSFLDRYLTEGPQSKLWKESITLIAKQSMRSTSAFRLLYKCYEYYKNLDINQKKLLFNTLVKVSHIMYHDFQKQFMANVLDEVYIFDDDKINNINSDDLLCHYLNECKLILQNPETNTVNIDLICHLFENIWCTIQLDNKKVLEVFLSCCLVIPIKVLENMRPYPVQNDSLPKFITMCCAQNFVTSNTSFNALEECIKAANQFSKSKIDLCNLVVDIFCFKHYEQFHHEFINNLMVHLAGFMKNAFTNESFDDMFSVFICIIISISGFDGISSDDGTILKCTVFPHALATFAKNSAQTFRIIEWLKTMRSIQNLSEDYTKLFNCCLAALKHDVYFKNWMNTKKFLL
ncbi:uncharacterized protein LOC126835384 isoform X2 [Adelges cooleyi]|nr:uncharacterized protein LOC126835384 isoform X2 [Adelges cooleyi]